MALTGPVIFKEFQMVPEIIIFLLLGFTSKLESELAKKIYASCPWKQRALVLLNLDISCFANNVDPDQLASSICTVCH